MKKEKTDILIHVILIAFSIACIVPFMSVVSVSLTSMQDISKYGFRLLPPKVDFSAYLYLLKNPKEIIDAYMVTVFVTATHTVLSLLVQSLTAYALSRDSFKMKNIVVWYIFFPTLFSGGLVSSYIINTRYLGFVDSYLSMILPGLAGMYNIVMIRTFFKQLPEGLFDAAKIDGAGEWRIYFTIAMRLSKPVLASLGFMKVMAKWNEWYFAMLYIRSAEKYPLQYLLQRIMRDLQILLNNMDKIPGGVDPSLIMGENIRMALLVICIGPAMFAFPFFQKYFSKGLTVGAVKG